MAIAKQSIKINITMAPFIFFSLSSFVETV